MKRLPLGIQTFSEIINGNMLYVDKTDFIPKMTERYKYVFLSRPRRFGKSLFVSTLEEFFKGNKALFEGLNVLTSESWSTYPVIRIDFSTIPNKTPEIFSNELIFTLREIGLRYGVNINSDFPQRAIDLLVKGIREKYDKPIVILVDEYDKPIVDHLDKILTAEGNKTVLRDFFASIKGLDEHIKFMFITGVSKFSKVSLFSGMNQIVDISLNSDFSEIMGYTAKEIEIYFKDYLNGAIEDSGLQKDELIKSLAHWYNGYSWDGSSRVFNPFSVLNFFDSRKFDNFWFSSGTPSHLVKLFKQDNFDLSLIENAETRDSAFNTDDLSRISLLSILFQTGYLTVKRTQDYSGVKTYTVDYPNYEVKDAVYRLITSELLNKIPETVSIRTLKIKEALESGDTSLFLSSLRGLFAQIPSVLYMDEEKYYHFLFIMIMYMSGIEIESEVNTNIGRIDGVIETKDKIYIIEFKLDKTPGEALQQIFRKKYYEKYTGREKEIVLMGVSFTCGDIKMITESV
ncbi:MAG: ATP-binding protein [Ignavibacteriaceae bacterium]|nr:ATP-binding protein [Ignavibacteriaceae bacterium]